MFLICGMKRILCDNRILQRALGEDVRELPIAVLDIQQMLPKPFSFPCPFVGTNTRSSLFQNTVHFWSPLAPKQDWLPVAQVSTQCSLLTKTFFDNPI